MNDLRKPRRLLLFLLLSMSILASCATSGEVVDEQPPMDGALKVDKGVDLEGKTIRIAVFNDESGPAASIGKPYAAGKRMLAAQVNAGGSGLLPDGWKIELVERDHAYDGKKAVDGYGQVKDDVLYVAHSFGTPATLALKPMLTGDHLVAFPASLSSEMAQDAWTPPAGPTYAVEAMRAMDFAVEKAGDVGAVKAAIVYQEDDYGKDGLGGWEEAAKHHGVTIVAKQTVSPGQADFAGVVKALEEAGATHVLITTLPSATGPILGEAAKAGFAPMWLGSTPSWMDGFFDAKVLPAAALANFHWVTGLPYWGEEVPGMTPFMAAWEAHGKALSGPDFYTLTSYMQGLIGLEAVRRAIESGDLTREGFLAALQTIRNYDGGGLFQPLSYHHLPYVTGTRARVLKPDAAAGRWEVVSEYRDPATIVSVP